MTQLPNIRYYLEEHWLIHISKGWLPKPILRRDYDPMLHYSGTIIIPEKYETDEIILALKLS